MHGTNDDTRPGPLRAGSIERWCLDFVGDRELETKLAPPPAPDAARDASWSAPVPPPTRLRAPGRPPELRVGARSPRSAKPGALVRPRARARLLHTFLHHELQAAELFAWALLAFPDTPRAFRRGLLALCQEELAHLALYRAHLSTLGFDAGAFDVRDWFWERVTACETPTAFVALVGVGLEGANLEHTARFAASFRAAGDAEGARILERVERDEIAHVAFAVRWFEAFTGAALEYDAWSAALPAPLTPAVLRGRPLNRDARTRAGLDDAFLTRLANEPSTGRRVKAARARGDDA